MLDVMGSVPSRMTKRGRAWLMAYAECGDPTEAAKRLSPPPADPADTGRNFTRKYQTIVDLWTAESLSGVGHIGPAETILGLSELARKSDDRVRLGAFRTLAEVHGLLGGGSKGLTPAAKSPAAARLTSYLTGLVSNANLTPPDVSPSESAPAELKPN